MISMFPLYFASFFSNDFFVDFYPFFEVKSVGLFRAPPFSFLEFQRFSSFGLPLLNSIFSLFIILHQR